jgi:hypothetical protein
MCQAYEAEANFIRSGEDRVTTRGYAAHRDGFLITDNPHPNGYYFEAWKDGWECREDNVIPWAIEKLYRANRKQETGQLWCFEKPTKEQADSLV